MHRFERSLIICLAALGLGHTARLPAEEAATAPLAASPEKIGVIGMPLASVEMPESCHPFRRQSGPLTKR